MAGVQKGLLICVLYNDTANSSDCLMSSVWLMGDELKGEELLFRLATNQKFPGSIPDGVLRNFHWQNPSGRTKVLRLTQTLTEMSTRVISWGLRWSGRRADNQTTFMWQLSRNMGASTSCKLQCISRPVTGFLYFNWVWRRRLTEDNLFYLSRDGPLPDRLSFRGAMG